MPDPRKVFVIHGRNRKIIDSMFSFLRALDLKPIEWNEARQMTGKGSPHISDILDAAFENAQAVIALFTPDDEVRLKPEFWEANDGPNEKEYMGQSRPNVLFEAGLAFGRHDDRTILVRVGDVKWFSDIGGRHFIRLGDGQTSRNDLASALEAVGCPVNRRGQQWLEVGEFSIEQKSSAIATVETKSHYEPKVLVTFHKLTQGGQRSVDRQELVKNGITVGILARFIPEAESKGWLIPCHYGDVESWLLTRNGVLQAKAALETSEG